MSTYIGFKFRRCVLISEFTFMNSDENNTCLGNHIFTNENRWFHSICSVATYISHWQYQTSHDLRKTCILYSLHMYVLLFEISIAAWTVLFFLNREGHKPMYPCRKTITIVIQKGDSRWYIYWKMALIIGSDT